MNKTVAPALATTAIFTALLWGHQADSGTVPTPSPALSLLCAAELGPELDEILDRPELQRARTGVLIQTQATTEEDITTLYARDTDQYFIPASSTKLLIAAAALQQLGPTFRVQTTIYRLPVTGDQTILKVVGQGDPSLRDQDLQRLARQLPHQGIGAIDQLLGDDSRLGPPQIHPTWEWVDVQQTYGAPINSLILNQNALEFTLWPQALGTPLKIVWSDPRDVQDWQVFNQSLSVAPSEPEFLRFGQDFNRKHLYIEGQLRVGAAPEPTGVAVSQPGKIFLEKLRRALAAEQIPVQTTRLLSISEEESLGQIVATLPSPPLTHLLVESNQESNNLYAEVLLRWLGLHGLPPGHKALAETPLDRGLQQLTATLTALGVDPDSHTLVDGSGLSRHNQMSPRAIVQTLQGMGRSPYAETYRQSLALGGIRGTLQRRFQNTAAQGRLWGKTGTLTGISALSGYLHPPHYRPLVFSILINDASQSAFQLGQIVDAIVLALTRLQPCEPGDVEL